jgi:hypothetical protein
MHVACITETHVMPQGGMCITTVVGTLHGGTSTTAGTCPGEDPQFTTATIPLHAVTFAIPDTAPGGTISTIAAPRPTATFTISGAHRDAASIIVAEGVKTVPGLCTIPDDVVVGVVRSPVRSSVGVHGL